MKTNNLTIKQEAFCQAYIELGEATAAYKKAGYSYENKLDKSIHEAASRILNNSKVTARLKELQGKVAKIAEEKFDITHEEMLRHLNILRNSRIDEYVEFKKGKLIFKDFDKLTPEQLMCIESIKQTPNGVEIKLHGKEWTIEKINKHIGFYPAQKHVLQGDKNNPVYVQNAEELTPEQQEARIEELVAKALKK